MLDSTKLSQHHKRVAETINDNKLSHETLDDLKDAIIELYLAIKIRSTEEVSVLSNFAIEVTISRVVGRYNRRDP